MTPWRKHGSQRMIFNTKRLTQNGRYFSDVFPYPFSWKIVLVFDIFFGVLKVLVDNAAESVKVEAWCRKDIISKTMLTQLDVKIWNMCCENLAWEHPESECLYLRDQTWCVCIGLRPRERPARRDNTLGSNAVASTPGRENARACFAGDWACGIELRQTGVICFPWRQRSWSCGVFKSWISDAHCPFQWKWQVLHNYDISVLQQVGVFFNGIACMLKVSAFVQAGVPSCLNDSDAPLVREFLMWRRRSKHREPHWFQGRQICFCYISLYIGSDYIVQLFFNQSPLHHIFNCWLSPTIACEPQATACDIEISLGILWFYVNCIFKENVFPMYWFIS